MQAKLLKTKPYNRRKPEKTLLYKTIAANLETFLAEREQDGRGLPSHVADEMRAYLKCGILHHGFMRVRCESCEYEGAVAYSCKKRGFCPSCCGKRMVETTDHLLENILPDVGYRQYVVSLPVPLRFWCATNKKLTSKVHALIKETLIHYIEEKARAAGCTDPLPGGITFIQRAGSALNLNVHFHILALDGAYVPPANRHGKPRFKDLPPPTEAEVASLVETIAGKVIRHLRKAGYLSSETSPAEIPPLDEAFGEHPDYAQAVQASIQGRIAFGPNAGGLVRRIGSGFGYEEETPLVKGAKCASINGFSLHAATHAKRFQRDKLKLLVRYMSRPPVASSRLERHPTRLGELVYTLKSKWRDGTTAIALTPMELLEKLSALVPLPKSHLVRYWGVFASHSQWRDQVVLRPEKRKGFAPDGGYDPKKVKNTLWARLLYKTFGVDVSTCPACGGEMRIIAMVHDRLEISRFLKHIGREEHPPPVAPARYEQGAFDYDETYLDEGVHP